MQKITFLIGFFILSCFSNQKILGEVFTGPTDLAFKVFDDLSIKGPAKLKMVKAKTLEVQGPLKFHNLAVAEKAIIKGAMQGDKGKFGPLEIEGFAEIDHVICDTLKVKGAVNANYLDVNKDAAIEGALHVHYGKFQNLIVKGNEITLEDVTINNIIISKNQPPSVIILKGRTLVNGNITFESNDGVVTVENSEVLIKGEIIGGIKQ